MKTAVAMLNGRVKQGMSHLGPNKFDRAVEQIQKWEIKVVGWESFLEKYEPSDKNTDSMLQNTMGPAKRPKLKFE